MSRLKELKERYREFFECIADIVINDGNKLLILLGRAFVDIETMRCEESYRKNPILDEVKDLQLKDGQFLSAFEDLAKTLIEVYNKVNITHWTATKLRNNFKEEEEELLERKRKKEVKNEQNKGSPQA
jgi:hypothetical protein